MANAFYAPERHSWTVELSPGSSVVPGFAAYLCAILAGEGMIDRHTRVRVVDGERLASSRFDYQTATIDHVNCRRFFDEQARTPDAER